VSALHVGFSQPQLNGMFVSWMKHAVKRVPEAIRDAFYAGARSSKLPFCVNDTVRVVVGEYSGRKGSVISVESIGPDPQFLEL
jgi:hypothetical protein